VVAREARPLNGSAHRAPLSNTRARLRRAHNGPALAGHGAEAVRDAIAATIMTLPAQLRRSLTWDSHTGSAWGRTPGSAARDLRAGPVMAGASPRQDRIHTATEVALLVLAGTGAASGLPGYAIMVMPLLFASGISCWTASTGCS